MIFTLIKKLPKDRKLWICVIMFITSIMFIFTNNVIFQQWSQFFKYTFIIFSGSLAVDSINIKEPSNWKSRKLWTFFGIYFVTVVMVLTNFAQFGQWSEFVNWLYGAYATTNIGTTILKSKRKRRKLKK